MAKKISDSGINEKFQSRPKRIIEKDGSFNIIKKGGAPRNLYQQLIAMNWPRFFFTTLMFYLGVNLVFACAYFVIGVEYLNGVPEDRPLAGFLYCFFFSVQTFTTVGYGAIHPVGLLANAVATIEAMFGLMGFALITGLLYGKFSRPDSKLKFSENVLFHKEGDKYEMHFQMINARDTLIIEPSVRVLLKLYHHKKKLRNFYNLDLRISKIMFFPTNWRIVHEITEKSPLYSLKEEDLIDMDVEIIILFQGYDESFNQQIYVTHSYGDEQILWNKHFLPSYNTDEDGNTVLDMETIDAFEND
ncbi:MAG: ion channel [Schleiferiaceae bacterium]|jgi:inward rectifier potassium channel|nr:ion channel [Schleiferiaceae bacterium]